MPQQRVLMQHHLQHLSRSSGLDCSDEALIPHRVHGQIQAMRHRRRPRALILLLYLRTVQYHADSTWLPPSLFTTYDSLEPLLFPTIIHHPTHTIQHAQQTPPSRSLLELPLHPYLTQTEPQNQNQPTGRAGADGRKDSQLRTKKATL